MIEFTRHSTRHETDSSLLRTWRSKCGRYCITESVSKFGLSTVYYAALRDAYGWRNLKAMERFPHFRKLNAARTACSRHATQRRFA